MTDSTPPAPQGAGLGGSATLPDARVFDRVRQVVADVFQIELDQVTPGSDASGIERWDSINHLNLMLALEGEFGTTFPPDEADRLDSIAAIVVRLGGVMPAGRIEPAAPAPAASGPVVRPLAAGDLAAVVALLSRRDGIAYAPATVARYLCDLDPARFQGWLALDGDRPVGMTAYYVRDLVCGTDAWRAGYWSNLYVHEDYRKLPIYPRLVHAMMTGAAAAGIDLVFTGMRRDSVADAHIRLGFREMGAIGVRVKPLRPFRLLSRYRGWRWAERPGALPDACYGAWLAARRRLLPPGFRTEVADPATRTLDELLAVRERRAAGTVHQRWTAADWRDRFAATLEGGAYTLLVARRGAELAGGLLARVATRESPAGGHAIPLGIVMDTIVAESHPEALPHLLAAAETFAAGRGALAMLWLDGAAEVAAGTRAFGYVASSESYRLIVWPGSIAPDGSPLRDIARWRYTFSEHDAF